MDKIIDKYAAHLETIADTSQGSESSNSSLVILDRQVYKNFDQSEANITHSKFEPFVHDWAIFEVWLQRFALFDWMATQYHSYPCIFRNKF